jgi:hypothetical protein
LPGCTVRVSRELERGVGIHGRHELDANFATDVGRFLDGHGFRIGAPAETRDLAEHVVEGHERKAEAEHGNRQDSQATDETTIFLLLVAHIRNAALRA